jgi:hypothetical protein
MTYGFLATGFLFSTVVVIMVILNTPTPKDVKNNKGVNIIKTFIISFLICSAIAYVMQEPDTNNMMNNILKTEPDF